MDDKKKQSIQGMCDAVLARFEFPNAEVTYHAYELDVSMMERDPLEDSVPVITGVKLTLQIKHSPLSVEAVQTLIKVHSEKKHPYDFEGRFKPAGNEGPRFMVIDHPGSDTYSFIPEGAASFFTLREAVAYLDRGDGQRRFLYEKEGASWNYVPAVRRLTA